MSVCRAREGGGNKEEEKAKSLLDCDALSQVPRHVDVAVLRHGHVVRKELQRNNVEDALQAVDRLRDPDHAVPASESSSRSLVSRAREGGREVERTRWWKERGEERGGGRERGGARGRNLRGVARRPTSHHLSPISRSLYPRLQFERLRHTTAPLQA